MNFVTDFRNPDIAKKIIMAIKAMTTQQWTLMEVCGGQTHSLIKHGIDQLLAPHIRLIHGPGCPVCVTPLDYINKALAIAAQPNIIFCSFGDMLRVPGSHCDLLALKAQGADIRIVYSPLEAIKIAQQCPEKEVVFFAVGFETTAPLTALTALQAQKLNMHNFSLLVCHVLVPPVMRTLLASPQTKVQGFLAAGHVCAIMGTDEYLPIATQFHTPIVVTGFEPIDLLQGIYACVLQLEEGRGEVENAYRRVVRTEGNSHAQQAMKEVFIIVNRRWRGLGDIANSGLTLSPVFAAWNAEQKFSVTTINTPEPTACRSGEVLQGLLKPSHCPAFGITCTPEHPLGATMVSTEGACAAYYRYRRKDLF
jgi:hydrogenase expression/formation protein HypD